MGLIVLLSWAVPSLAQQQADSGGGLTLGDKAGRSAEETCVEVEIGGERSPTLDCLNRRLRRAVDRVQPVGNVPPASAASPATRVGGFNETAMSQQFGQNWGKSVFPYRPPAPVYGSNLR
jgi:hypothetical protein